jgi:amidase
MTHTAAEVGALDGLGQAELVRSGVVSPTELVTWAVERIEELNPTLHAVVTPMYERALDAAKVARSGPFAGVPYLLKDLVTEVAGVRFTEGSRFVSNYVSHYDSELVVRLRRAGLVIVGKTNTPEFGLVPTCEPALFGPTRNPWDIQRSTSGSSGGSAAAVASGMVPGAHANDLGGSIRFPASACGLFGLKPTRARNPLGPEYGDAVSGWAVEHALTRSVRDSAALLDATSGPALGDPYWAPPPHRPFLAEVGRQPGRLRIGYSALTPDGSPGAPDCLEALRDAVALCTSLGHELMEVDLPGLTPEVGKAIGIIYNSATAWIVRYWSRRIGRAPEPDQLEPITREYWHSGERTTGGEYLEAIEDLQRFARRIAEFFTSIDMWLTPTMSTLPPLLGASLADGEASVKFPAVVANITGNPAMSVPLWWNATGLPVGVHFLGRFGDEASLFQLAAQLEQARPWNRRIPPVNAIRERVLA